MAGSTRRTWAYCAPGGCSSSPRQGNDHESTGFNYFPHDIEQAILRRLGQNELNKFIACGRSNAASGRDELVVFVYFKRGEAAFRRLAEQVRQAVLASFGLDVAQVAPVRRVPKTTSGKVQRFKLLAQHQPHAAHLLGVADVEPRAVKLAF